MKEDVKELAVIALALIMELVFTVVLVKGIATLFGIGISLKAAVGWYMLLYLLRYFFQTSRDGGE